MRRAASVGFETCRRGVTTFIGQAAQAQFRTKLTGVRTRRRGAAAIYDSSVLRHDPVLGNDHRGRLARRCLEFSQNPWV